MRSVKEGARELSEFKIAKILKAEKHPNADKLKVCDVSLGDKKVLKLFVGRQMQERIIDIFMHHQVPLIPNQNLS